MSSNAVMGEAVPDWHPLAQAVAAAERALTELGGVASWTAPDDVVVDCVMRLSRLSAQIDAQRLRLVHDAGTRGVSTSRGAASMPAWLRGVLNVRPGAAAREVRLAEALHSTCEATGEALAAGRINTDAAGVITTAVAGLPPEWHEARAEAEQILLTHAETLDPAALTRVARHLAALTDEHRRDELAEDFHVRNRELHLRTDPDDGRLHLRGWLDAEAGDLFRTCLDAFTAPRPAENDTPDRRSPAQRNADALAEVARGVADGGGLPTSGGNRPHLTVTLDWDMLRAQVVTTAQEPRTQSAPAGARSAPAAPAGALPGSGVSQAAPAAAASAAGAGAAPSLTAWDTLLTPATSRRLACDARVIPVILASESQPLDVGRATYTVPPPLRAALVTRDRGCAFPGCDRPPGWCHAHHIQHWADGGETKLDNLVLLCGHHHRYIHHRDWQVHIDPDGHPAFTPPAWIDPAQIPRRQTWRTDTAQLAADREALIGRAPP